MSLSEVPEKGVATGANCSQVVVIISSFHRNSELLPLAKRFLQQPVINSTLKRSRALLFLSDKNFCRQLLPAARQNFGFPLRTVGARRPGVTAVCGSIWVQSLAGHRSW